MIARSRRSTASRAGSGDGLGADELLEKGRLLDRIGRYDEAFAAFAEGNRRCRDGDRARLPGRGRARAGGPAHAVLHRGRLRDPAARSAAARRRRSRSSSLVFRARGRRLSNRPCRRIRASPPATSCPLSTRSPRRCSARFNSPLGYPEALAELWMGDRRHGLDDLRDDYLERVRRLGISTPGARRGSPTRCRSMRRISG